MRSLDGLLQESSARHKHLCPRQVLGVRMGLYAAELLQLDLPRADKRLLVIAETDGCAVDGLIAATGCRVGSRTLRILDFGKVAATFVDTYTEKAIRLVPTPESRSLAMEHSPNARTPWEAMLKAYQVIPNDHLLKVQAVRLEISLAEIISKPGRKSNCMYCGEEIINGREVSRGNLILCRSCAGEGYYHHSALAQLAQDPVVSIRSQE